MQGSSPLSFHQLPCSSGKGGGTFTSTTLSPLSRDRVGHVNFLYIFCLTPLAENNVVANTCGLGAPYPGTVFV